MRALILVALMLAPAAAALHPIERDLSAEVSDGASIVLAVQASGSIVSRGSGQERHGSGTTDVTHAYTFTYSWGGTLQLDLRADGLLSGDAQLSGGGTGRLSDHAHRVVRNFENEVVNEIDTYRDCDPNVRLSNNGKLHARGLIDPETSELLVIVRGIGDPTPQRECTFRSEGGEEQSNLFPRPPLSPLLVEGIGRVSRGEADVRRLEGSLDEINAANALIFRVPLAGGHTIVRGGGSAPLPATYGSTPLGYACPKPMDPQIVKGTCSVAGTLDVRVLVDPCPVLRESRAAHLAAVKALAKPANGSSESQVRAFAVDARQKVGALLADERALQLICGDEGGEALVVVADAARKVVEAWADVAKTHGLSDEGKRDLVAAERGHQLVGGESSAEVSAVVGEIVSNPGDHGRVTVNVHSPVALHAWDEQGRHVGWNATTNASESQIDGANYTGEPGDAQELSLPSGFYKIAVVELDEGAYLLDSSWNGTVGDGAELLPAASEDGRTLVMNVLLDEHGFLAGPAQRIATEARAPFAFVEAWRPMDAGPAPAAGAARAADASDGPSSPGEGGAGVPGAGLALVVIAGATVAIAARRRD